MTVTVLEDRTRLELITKLGRLLSRVITEKRFRKKSKLQSVRRGPVELKEL
jgi:hypothetical protein